MLAPHRGATCLADLETSPATLRRFKTKRIQPTAFRIEGRAAAIENRVDHHEVFYITVQVDRRFTLPVTLSRRRRHSPLVKVSNEMTWLRGILETGHCPSVKIDPGLFDGPQTSDVMRVDIRSAMTEVAILDLQ